MPMTLSGKTSMKLDIMLGELMGWELQPNRLWKTKGIQPDYIGLLMAYPPHPAYGSCDNTYWSPSTNIMHAWMVVSHVNTLPCAAIFRARIAGVDILRLSAAEVCIAICESALECC